MFNKVSAFRNKSKENKKCQKWLRADERRHMHTAERKAFFSVYICFKSISISQPNGSSSNHLRSSEVDIWWRGQHPTLFLTFINFTYNNLQYSTKGDFTDDLLDTGRMELLRIKDFKYLNILYSKNSVNFVKMKIEAPCL